MVSEVHVNIRKRLEVSFGVRGRRARGGRGVGAEVTVGGAEHLHRLIEPFHEHGVGLVLMPLDAAGFAVHADVEVVLFAHRNLRAMQHALGAIGEAQQHVAVIIKLATFHKGSDVRGQLLDLQAGDVLGEILRVSANIANATGGAAAFWVGAPVGLLLATGLQPRGQPALRILDDHFANLTQLAGGNHVARFFHQRITGVIVGQAVQALGLFHQFLERLGFLEIEGGRFVAEHVKPVFQRHLGGRKMHVVRCHNRHKIHALAFG